MEAIFTLEEIGAIAKELLMITSGQQVYAIHGEMGAGKTTFIHALCEAMEVRDHITSPTFSIINEYTNRDGKIIFHMDLYRIKDEEEAINAGVEECLVSGNTCLVEWPEKAMGILPGNTMHIQLTFIDNNTRKLQSSDIAPIKKMPG